MVCNIKDSLFTDPELDAARRFMLDTARFYHANRAFLPRAELTAPRLADLLALVDAGFRSLFSGSPITRIGRNRFLKLFFIPFELEPAPAAQTAWYGRRPTPARPLPARGVNTQVW